MDTCNYISGDLCIVHVCTSVNYPRVMRKHFAFVFLWLLRIRINILVFKGGLVLLSVHPLKDELAKGLNPIVAGITFDAD